MLIKTQRIQTPTEGPVVAFPELADYIIATNDVQPDGHVDDRLNRG